MQSSTGQAQTPGGGSSVSIFSSFPRRTSPTPAMTLDTLANQAPPLRNYQYRQRAERGPPWGVSCMLFGWHPTYRDDFALCTAVILSARSSPHRKCNSLSHLRQNFQLYQIIANPHTNYLCIISCEAERARCVRRRL